MQVKRIAAPAEAHRSPFGSSGFWLADSREVASFTHVGDRITGYPAPELPRCFRTPDYWRFQAVADFP